MKAFITRLGKLLKSLVHLCRLKRSKVLNPSVLMGIVSPDAAPANVRMWGDNPVHPKSTAYKTMAARILDEIASDTVLHPRRPSDDHSSSAGLDRGATLAAGPSRHRNRESWTSGNQTVAARHDYADRNKSNNYSHGGQNGGPSRTGQNRTGGNQHHRKPYGRRF